MKTEAKQKISAGLAIIYNNKLLLAHPYNRRWYNSYGIPKGGVDEGETYLDAAIRETKEEVGINVPKKLIDKKENKFFVSFSPKNKKGYTKVVYYYVVKIDNLSQLGITDLRIPKKQLQLEEVDWAGFIDYKELQKRITPSQIPLINNLISKGLLESTLLNYEKFIESRKH